jgi:hypothetical protein
MTKYVKICKIKYVLFYCKSREMNLSFAIFNLSCFSKNMYLHTNPSPIHHYYGILAKHCRYTTDTQLYYMYNMYKISHQKHYNSE